MRGCKRSRVASGISASPRSHSRVQCCRRSIVLVNAFDRPCLHKHTLRANRPLLKRKDDDACCDAGGAGSLGSRHSDTGRAALRHCDPSRDRASGACDQDGRCGPHVRTFIKDIKQPDPICKTGQENTMKVMQSGRMYRYNVGKADESEVSLCEKAITDYTGHKYCVALNSCGSAIFLMLKAAGVKPGDKVLSNAFTFGAVPSAIEHAGGTAVYVASLVAYVMDTEELEVQLKANPDCKYVLISHMRGKLADMDAIKAVCDRYEATLLEDCAHSLGVYWKGKHSGHHGKAACISSQSYKMLNSGEGGFFLTDDDYMAAAVATYAGAYEGLSVKHLTVPPLRHSRGFPTSCPTTRCACPLWQPL